MRCLFSVLPGMASNRIFAGEFIVKIGFSAFAFLPFKVLLSFIGYYETILFIVLFICVYKIY